jgi:hypothetical protein
MLTLSKLKEMKPGVFASGIASVEDYWDTSKTMDIKWVATRGYIHDWAIYYQLLNKNWSEAEIENIGDKMHNRKSVKQCVPCDDEALDMYRD